MTKPISTLLQEIRIKTKWSQPRIAKEIGTSQPTVNRILAGQDECKSSTLRRIEELHREKVHEKTPIVVEGRVIDGAVVREAVDGLRIPKTDTRRLRE